MIQSGIRPLSLRAGRAMSMGVVFFAVGALGLVGSACAGSPGSGSPEVDRIPPLPFAERAAILKSHAELKQVALKPQAILLSAGPATAPIVVDDFADYRCPHCYTAYLLLETAARRWPGRIKVVHRNFPLDGNCNPVVSRKQLAGGSCRAAKAVVCAAEQKIFATVHGGLFRLQETNADIDDTAVQGIVEKAGGDYVRLSKCMDSPQTLASIGADVAAGESFGIEATPTLVVAGRLLPSGSHEPRALLHLLDALVYEREGQAAEADLIGRISAPGR